MFLQLQSCFTRAVGNRRDAPVVLESAAVEHHRAHTRGLGALADELADLLGGIDRCARARTQVGFHRRRARNRATAEVVDRLHVDVLVRTEHREARPFRGARHLLAYAAVPPDAVLGFGERHNEYLYPYFADFPALRCTRWPR